MHLVRAAFRHSLNYYLAVISEIVSPAVRALATIWCGRTSPPASWKKGLIVTHTHIGDVLYRAPSLPHLARLLPGCQWYYLCSEGSAAVLRGRNDLAGVLPFVIGEDSWTLKSGGFSALRKHHFDVALCSNTLRRYPDLLLCIALRIPNRVSYNYKGLSGLLTKAVRVNYPSPFPAYFRAMVGQVGNAPGDWALRPSIPLDAADSKPADELYDKLNPGNGPVLVCCPTTRQTAGAWPSNHFLAAAEEVAEASGARVLMCGAATDRALLEAMARHARVPCDVIAGTLSIKSFAALISRCTVVLAQDSAPRHLANAVGTPVVFLRNLGGSHVETGVYCDSEIDAAPSDEFVTEAGSAEVFAATSPSSIAQLVLRAMSSRPGHIGSRADDPAMKTPVERLH
ncbi:MAG: glycosyltransferase family 9 protein [Gemmatimonadaceae bacterium]